MKLEIGQKWHIPYNDECVLECVMVSECGRVGVFLVNGVSTQVYSIKELNESSYEIQQSEKRPTKVKCEITDFDIATVEALHDLLIDEHGYPKDSYALEQARELTKKMYEAFENGEV